MRFRILLAPFALLYGTVVKLRNLLFDYRILKSVSVEKPTICVGNLTVGGTGKTPHVEYLVTSLSKYYRIATLSRGYKRKSKGFRYVQTHSTSAEVGDEPLQLKLKFPEIVVAVDGNRVRGANRILNDHPEINLILLDDAFQHRSIKSGYSILLVDYNNLINNDYFLPLGRLRDSFREKRRAECIFVTKCPSSINIETKEKIIRDFSLLPTQSVFFTRFEYGNPIPVFKETTNSIALTKDTIILAFAGIANPNPFFKYLDQVCILKHNLAFPDHHAYSVKKIRAIFEKYKSIESDSKAIITTEKDAVRVKNLEELDESIKKVLFYIPVEVVFIDKSGADFNQNIETYVRENKGNS